MAEELERPEDREAEIRKTIGVPIVDRESPLGRLLLLVSRSFVSENVSPELRDLLARATDEYLELLLLSTPNEVAGKSRRYYKVEQLNGSDAEPSVDDRVECKREEANVVGSLCQDGFHRPVIDIDHNVQLVPSSTLGHYHLYLGVPMEKERYFKLLHALVDAGVVSSFYVKAADVRGQTFVRLPGVRKEKKL